jgi:hypothetical protein
MKKTLFISIVFFALVSSKVKAQSNLTWTFLGQIDKGEIKKSKVVQINLNGFTDQTEATTALNVLKTNAEIISCTTSKVDAKGNCDLVLTLKNPHDKSFYLGLAQKMGVDYIMANNKKKSVADLVAGKK